MMIDTVIDFVTRSFALDMAGWIVLMIFAGAGYIAISAILGDQLTAAFGTPVLVGGSAMGFRAMADLGIVFAPDKLMNMSIGMATCMMLSGILLIAMLWSWNASMTR